MSVASQRRLVETLLWLCEIPSPIGEERAICDRVEERVARVSLASPVRRYGDSLVVSVSRGTGGPQIALAGHLDVVRTAHDAPPRIEGDKLYGPGAADMKSGLACMIDLVEASPELFRAIDLTLVFYAREEGPYLENELGVVLAEDPELRGVDLAVCLEPSDNKLSLGASGSIHATVTFRGKTAHSARPWQGQNAIHMAGELLCDLHRLTPREVTLDGLVYRTVTSATMAQGGRGRNVVPDELALNLNHRFSPDTSIEAAQRDIEALVAGRAAIEWNDLSPSAPPHANDPLVVALREAGVVAVEPKQAWTDVARFAALGVAAVNFGPGENAQAHQRNEWTSIEKLVSGREILARFSRGETRVLSNAMLLTEGYDEPSIDCVVCLRPTKIRSLYSQIVGRGTRLYPGKDHLLLLDFLWMSEEHALMKPANLIAGDADEAAAITEALGFGGDLEEAKVKADADRAATLRQRLRQNAKRNARTFDALEFALSLGDVELADFLLESALVATVPGSVFGANGHIRLSYATSRTDIEQGVQRIKEALSRLSK